MSDFIECTIEKLASYTLEKQNYIFVGVYKIDALNMENFTKEIKDNEKRKNDEMIYLYLLFCDSYEFENNDDVMDLYIFKNGQNINKLKINKNYPLTEKKLCSMNTMINNECSICYEKTHDGIICEWCGGYMCFECNLSHCFLNSAVEFNKNIITSKCPTCRHNKDQIIPQIIYEIIKEFVEIHTDKNEIMILLYDNKIIPKSAKLISEGNYKFSILSFT